MSIGSIVEPEQAVVLRGPRLAGIIKQFFLDVVWPSLDVIVVDLPPGTGDIQLTLVQTVPITGAVLVTTPQQVALDDAIKAMNMFLLPNVNVPILGVVENMSWFTPADLPDRKYELFGKGGGKRLAKAANTVLLGQVPLIQGIGEASDEGVPPAENPNHPAAGYYSDIAKSTLRQLAIRLEALPPTQPVQVS
jgi:ATP-binding protein involved in chromosome partitioning